jgi:hypothetical protein
MKKSSVVLTLLFFVAVAACAQPPVAGEKESRLSPIAFLTATDWLAKLPKREDGKTIAIHAHFAWAENRQAIRVSNQFVIDGKPAPYIDGIYFWNPQTQTIEFVWSDAEGNLSRGSVTPADGKLVHDFQVTHSDGKSDSYVARVTPQSDGSWTNEILAKKNGNLSPVVQVSYIPEKK